MNQQLLTSHQSQYIAWLLTRRAGGDSVESFASTLVDSQVDLNPHQVEAALFACRNPLSRGVILADEVGLGKTIEAGLVISQRWAERQRNVLIVVPANLRKQWHQELQDKFGLQGLILEAKSHNALRKQGQDNPFATTSGPVICSYQFAKSKAEDIQRVAWHLVVLDEAHRLRNVYKPSNVIARTLKDALAHVHSKVLLTATPLQNSLLELYGLVSMIDERVFGDIDSFRAQFTGQGRDQALGNLRDRLATLCKRTLRKQVQPYVSYTARKAIVEEFTPSTEERELSALVADYLRRPNLKSLPDGQRHLISLVLWKLLASSTHAIAGALETMAKRLEGVLDDAPASDLTEVLDEDYESLDETAEEWGAQDPATAKPAPNERNALALEIAELRNFKTLATNIRDNAKGKALLTALGKAFAELERLGAPKKAIIFTESRRTQDYLLTLLAGTPYGDGIILFNGTNSDERAQAIYKDWVKRHEGTDRVTGSRTADTRAALIDHFRDRGTVMIATEAGAEGINLQFCSLVINYDLPWNPQRIEQRIGRCHRYGQKFDVVVVNFVDRSNEADARVYELLAQKFQLFEGVFGASDEVLGAIGSGVDFERRIADIYQNCRDPAQIKASFEQLQLDLSGEINDAMVKTRQILLENFDEKVQERLRVRAEDSRSTRSRFERMLLDLTRTELGDCAVFDDGGFELLRVPSTMGDGRDGVALGHYELPRRTGEAHLYRVNHPLAQWITEQCKRRTLDGARLVFNYDGYGKQVSTLKAFRGKAGWLTLKLVSVDALGSQEQHLIVAATTDDGTPLAEDDPEKLLRFPATAQPAGLFDHAGTPLQADLDARKLKLLSSINQRNLGYFEQEVQKLDAWADDLKLGLEQEIKEIDREVKEVRRTASTSPTLEEKLSWQKRQRELEAKRTRLRRELFERQDNYHCRQCGAGGGFKLLQAIKGLDFNTVLRGVERTLGMLPASAPAAAGEPSAQRMRKLAQRIWAEARPVTAGDEVDRYLGGRSLALPVYPPVLRFHPALGYYAKDAAAKSRKLAEYPAMLACIQGADGHAVTLHRTYLKDGAKLKAADAKKVLSAGINGAAVRLFEPTDELAVCEGIETGIALHLATGKPVWAGISAGNLEKLWLPDTVCKVCIYADNDADGDFAGQRFGFALARRLKREEKTSGARQVQVFVPRHAGTDWADVWCQRRKLRVPCAA